MRCLFAGLALLSALAASAEAVTVSRDQLRFGDRDRTYYLYRPEGDAGARPAVVLLHGSGGNGLLMVERWKEVAAREQIVLIAPDALHAQVGWSLRDDGPDFIHGVIRAVAATYPIDMRRLYVFGQSGGAVYALNLAMLESEYFAAAAFHAGGWRKPAEYAFAGYAERKIPIAAYVGDKDEYFPVASVEDTQRILMRHGIPAELHLLPGRAHAYSDVPPDFQDTVWNFLNGNALSGLPKYTPYRFGAAPTR